MKMMSLFDGSGGFPLAASMCGINPVVYFFRAKNYFGMKDQQDVVIRPESPLGDTVDRDRLEATIVQELPEVADYGDYGAD